MALELTPNEDDDVTELPLGFEAGEDLARGGKYMDEYGYVLSSAEIEERLENEGTGAHRVYVEVQYRLPRAPVDRFETHKMEIDTMGELTAEELGRIVHDAARSVYKEARFRGEDTPPEVFVLSISVD